jgi:release factor glutamine methyltransferase
LPILDEGLKNEIAGPQHLGQLLSASREKLARGGVAEASLEARLIVEHFTDMKRVDAIRDPMKPISADAVEHIAAALQRRLSGEPVFRILGFRDFYGLQLRLSPDTLEPRPDTETLVELVLPFVREIAALEGECRILDLGTGTGAIALALLINEPKAVATATDISGNALATAATNANILGVDSRFRTLKSDWFNRVVGRFHLIVSNPPYIASSEIVLLHTEVRDFDPRVALDGGNDGLRAYRAIVRSAADHLAEEGYIAVEIGSGQKAQVAELFMQAGFDFVESASDLGGHERALLFKG